MIQVWTGSHHTLDTPQAKQQISLWLDSPRDTSDTKCPAVEKENPSDLYPECCTVHHTRATHGQQQNHLMNERRLQPAAQGKEDPHFFNHLAKLPRFVVLSLVHQAW